MGRTSRRVSLVAMLIVLFGTVASSANLISYTTWSANRNRVMVMDDTGANPLEIYLGVKFSPYGLNHTISPQRSDGTWVAFRDTDIDMGTGSALYKVKADGSGFTKVLCSSYDGESGVPHSSISGSRWSPDDRWIAVQTYEGIALVSVDFEVGLGAVDEACAAPLQFIYPDPDWDPVWVLESRVAWNLDGTQMAFIEILNFRDPDTEQIRIVVLERQEIGWRRVREVSTDVELFGKWPWSLDWQRGGDLLVIHTLEGSGPQGVFWINWIDITNGEWGYVTAGTSPSWSPDNNHLLIVDERGTIIKWLYPEGPGEVLGSGESPEWQRDELSFTCEIDADCDDGNLCTDDECVSGNCSNSPNFLVCDDGNECTDFDGCNEGLCVGQPISDGTPCDAGYCCGVMCVELACDIDSDCDDEDACTIDTCVFDAVNPCATHCEYAPDPACPSCLPKGTPCDPEIPCCSGMCHPVKGTCK